MNSINLIGRCGTTPEQKTTQSGKLVTNFRLAVDDGYGDKKKTIWVGVQCWEKTAEVVSQYLSKGDQVAVTGKLQSDEFTPKGADKPTTVFFIQAQNITFLAQKEKKEKADSAPQSEPSREPIKQRTTPMDQDPAENEPPF